MADASVSASPRVINAGGTVTISAALAELPAQRYISEIGYTGTASDSYAVSTFDNPHNVSHVFTVAGAGSYTPYVNYQIVGAPAASVAGGYFTVSSTSASNPDPAPAPDPYPVPEPAPAPDPEPYPAPEPAPAPDPEPYPAPAPPPDPAPDPSSE